MRLMVIKLLLCASVSGKTQGLQEVIDPFKVISQEDMVIRGHSVSVFVDMRL